MRVFDVVYDGACKTVRASDHVAARRLGSRYFAREFGAIDLDKLAVVDRECAARAPERLMPSFVYAAEIAEIARARLGTAWERLRQADLDRVHAIWARGEDR